MTDGYGIAQRGNVYFNSHPHEEDDESQLECSRRKRYFNSHPHEEDDCIPVAPDKSVMYFNSHPHEEDDNNEVEVDAFTSFQLTSSRRG